jgi:hypothetical protein
MLPLFRLRLSHMSRNGISRAARDLMIDPPSKEVSWLIN